MLMLPISKTATIKEKSIFLTPACDYLSFRLLCIILLVSCISQKTWSHLLEQSWKLVAFVKKSLLLKDDRKSKGGATINFISSSMKLCIYFYCWQLEELRAQGLPTCLSKDSHELMHSQFYSNWDLVLLNKHQIILNKKLAIQTANSKGTFLLWS